jgi:hypothetical protein
MVISSTPATVPPGLFLP